MFPMPPSSHVRWLPQPGIEFPSASLHVEMPVPWCVDADLLALVLGRSGIKLAFADVAALRSFLFLLLNF